jgi:hypothetical protein
MFLAVSILYPTHPRSTNQRYNLPQGEDKMTKFLKVHFTRAKVFQHHNGIAEQRFQVAPGVNTQVPLWVKNTLGWTMGVKDGSIVDLTPPDPSMFVAKAVKPHAEEPSLDEPGAEEPSLEEPEVEDKTGEEETGEETGEEHAAEAAPVVKPVKKPRSTHGLQK